MKSNKWNNKYLSWGVTAFFVIIACITFYWIILKWADIITSISLLLGILSPFIGGFVLAYLLTPFVKLFETKMFLPLGEKIFRNKEKKVKGFGRGMAILLSILILLGILSGIVSLIIPQIYNSVQTIVVNLSSSIADAEKWAQKWLADFPRLESTFNKVVDNVGNNFTVWAENSLLPQMDDVVASVSLGVVNVLKAITNLFIAIVVSVYLMYSRESFAAGGKKVLYSIFSVERVKKMLSALRYTDKSFMGFFIGKLLEALVVGMLCYVGCLIAGIPNAVLISVVIGITNIIPFFGPFIGGIPAVLIVLISSPTRCIVFIVFLLVLYQLDGNIMAPKILSNATGLSGFWVLFAIIVGGGLFGIVGMIIGVPIFAVIYAGLKTLVNNRLKKNGLPSKTVEYENISFFDLESQAPNPPKPKPTSKKTAKSKDIDKDTASDNKGK